MFISAIKASWIKRYIDSGNYGGTEVTSATLYLYCGHNLMNYGHNLVKPIKTAVSSQPLYGNNTVNSPGLKNAICTDLSHG